MITRNIIICCHLILLVTIETVSCFRRYQALIPNGAKVLDPCNNRLEWGGVGHQTRDGNTARNPFGRDFSSYGKMWTKNLCHLDSDGDGVSNGEELGDPDCRWVPGAVPAGPARSHPGICEPMTNQTCAQKNLWLDCSRVYGGDQAKCNNINNTSVISKDLRLTSTPVPDKETTYFCQLFDLNVSSDLHMIATEPLINASEVVHHILLFGCDQKAKLDSRLYSPYSCVMVPDDACKSLIGAWTLGSPGECAHPEMGFRVGPGGYRTVAIQVHWNNPTHMKGLTDTSGLRIFLTSSLRKHDAGMLVIGQQFLQIDPNSGSEVVKFSATCPERCTKVMFKSPIYVTSAVNHMHYLGKSQEIKVYRNTSVINIITDQQDYNYDDPLIYNFSKAIKILPGDEIHTSCVYKRPTSPNPVCWGEGTSDEMCFGFITYYPLQSLSYPWCTSMKSFPSCDRHLPDLGKHPFDGCRWWEFRNISHPETKRIMSEVFMKCYPKKEANLTCTDGCQAVATRVADHPCLQGDIGSYMMDKYKSSGPTGQQVLEAVITCSCRDFSYCDRKISQGILGSKQTQSDFCPSCAISWRMNILIICIAVFMFLQHL